MFFVLISEHTKRKERILCNLKENRVAPRTAVAIGIDTFIYEY
jgi:hypothetical protein